MTPAEEKATEQITQIVRDNLGTTVGQLFQENVRKKNFRIAFFIASDMLAEFLGDIQKDHLLATVLEANNILK